MRLIFATNNNHKLDEIKCILGNKYKDYIFSIKDFNISIEPIEDGKSFLDNANIKSRALYDEMHSNNLLKQDDYIISDDTGLCIDYLDGAPGIYSARYLGKDVPQDEKNNKILEIMKDVAPVNRRAYFITVLSVIWVVGDNIIKELSYDGKIYGYIARSIEKIGGFGYDPIFAVGDVSDLLNGTIKTYSNIGTIEKNKISHRARAIQKFVFFLEKNHNIL